MNKLFNSLMLAFFVLTSCSYHKETNQTRYSLHTMVGLTLFNGENNKFFNDFYEEIERENALVSNWLASSFASQISDSAGIKPVIVNEKRILDFLRRSVEFSRESGGRFNILIAPLTYLWGIGTVDAKVPSQEEIDSVLGLLDLNKIIFEGETVYLTEEGMSLDLGGIGKGYLIDHMVSWLKEKGVKKAILDLGGNIHLLGLKKEREDWKVSIREPHEHSRDYLASLTVLPNQTVSTSGSYERFFEDDGNRYHHILDSRTGYPVEGDLAFVTVILPSGLEADYYSTLGLILGLEEGMSLMKKKNITSVFVTKEREIYLVGINPQEFKLLDTSYRISN